MKKFIIILFFISSLCFSQYKTNNGINQGVLGYSIPKVTTPSILYNQRSIDFFARVTTAGKTLTDNQKAWYNDSIFVPLINAGIIGSTRAGDSLVFLYVSHLKHAGDSTIANMNILADVYNCISYGGVSYLDSGVQGGTNKWINTGFNPYADSTIAKKYSFGFGFICNANVGVSLADMGNSYLVGTYLGAFSKENGNLGQFLYRGDFKNYFCTTSRKFTSVSINESATNNMLVLLNSNYDTTFSISIGNLWDGNVTLLRASTTASYYSGSRCYPFFFLSSGLSATKGKALSDILNNSLKGYGYSVY